MHVRVWQTFRQRPDCKYFRFCGPDGPCHKYSLLPLSHQSNCRQHINEWAWRCSNKTLWTRILNFNIKTKTIEIYLLFFFQPLKNVNPFLAFRLYSRQQVGLCPQAAVGRPWHKLCSSLVIWMSLGPFFTVFAYTRPLPWGSMLFHAVHCTTGVNQTWEL